MQFIRVLLILTHFNAIFLNFSSLFICFSIQKMCVEIKFSNIWPLYFTFKFLIWIFLQIGSYVFPRGRGSKGRCHPVENPKSFSTWNEKRTLFLHPLFIYCSNKKFEMRAMICVTKILKVYSISRTSVTVYSIASKQNSNSSLILISWTPVGLKYTKVYLFHS